MTATLERTADEPWLDKREIANRFKVSTSTVERHGWPHVKVGRQNRYKVSEVEAYLRREDR
jgi:hypothetical protein